MYDRDGACLPSNHIVTIDGRKGRGSRIDSNQSMKCTSKNHREKWGQGRREREREWGGGERERHVGRKKDRQKQREMEKGTKTHPREVTDKSLSHCL